MYTVSQRGFWANMYIVHLVAQCVAPITAGRQCWKTTHYIVVQKPQCSCSLCSGQGQSKFTWINLESQKDIDLIFHCLNKCNLNMKHHCYWILQCMNQYICITIETKCIISTCYWFKEWTFLWNSAELSKKKINKTLSDVATYSSST